MLKKLVYFNRNDPRVWVYRHEKYKAIGVTFNFAKAASWVWSAGLIGFGVCFYFVFRWGANQMCGDCAAYELLEIFAVLFLVLIVGLICFWMAARDLKRYPGLQSARPETKELPECVKGMVGIIPAGEHDSVEEYHRHLVEKYDSVE